MLKRNEFSVSSLKLLSSEKLPRPLFNPTAPLRIDHCHSGSKTSPVNGKASSPKFGQSLRSPQVKQHRYQVKHHKNEQKTKKQAFSNEDTVDCSMIENRSAFTERPEDLVSAEWGKCRWEREFRRSARRRGTTESRNRAAQSVRFLRAF